MLNSTGSSMNSDLKIATSKEHEVTKAHTNSLDSSPRPCSRLRLVPRMLSGVADSPFIRHINQAAPVALVPAASLCWPREQMLTAGGAHRAVDAIPPILC